LHLPVGYGQSHLGTPEIDSAFQIGRARPFRDQLLPEYACALLNSEAAWQTLLRAGKTTAGLSTISAQNVKNASLMLPPGQAQAVFVRHEGAVVSIALQRAEASAKGQPTFDALLACAFA
jgi:hypothetical protein